MAYYTNFDEKEILNDAGETDVWDRKVTEFLFYDINNSNA